MSTAKSRIPQRLLKTRLWRPTRHVDLSSGFVTFTSISLLEILWFCWFSTPYFAIFSPWHSWVAWVTVLQRIRAIEREKGNSPQSPSLFSSSLYPLPLSTPGTPRNKWSNVRSFIILLSGEGLTSLSVNNRIYVPTFLVKKDKLKLSRVYFFLEHALKL